MNLQELQRKIAAKDALVGVIGLGYVGLPVACVFAQAGFRVVGIDIKPERVELINAGRSPIEGNEPGLQELLAEVVAADTFCATTDYNALKDADIITINVETPVGSDNRPHYEALRATSTSLSPVMKAGALVVVESTVAPGTVDQVVCPLLEEGSGHHVNQGFYLGACPERVMPGKLLANVRGISRVCGGSSPDVARVMVEFYRHVVQAELDPTDIITAELVKTAENAYRDVQIAFANEVALICESNGADVWQVRDLVNKSPYRQMHMPGAGVGGHCIPKDPWLLASSANPTTPIRLIPAARAINDSMPHHVASHTLQALEQAGLSPSAARVAVLGYTYLQDSDDTRNSPSIALVQKLREASIDVRIHDPWVHDYQGDIAAALQGCDALVLMVTHQEYHTLDLANLKEQMRTPILIDGRGYFDPAQVHKMGYTYRGVGR